MEMYKLLKKGVFRILRARRGTELRHPENYAPIKESPSEVDLSIRGPREVSFYADMIPKNAAAGAITRIGEGEIVVNNRSADSTYLDECACTLPSRRYSIQFFRKKTPAEIRMDEQRQRQRQSKSPTLADRA